MQQWNPFAWNRLLSYGLPADTGLRPQYSNNHSAEVLSLGLESPPAVFSVTHMSYTGIDVYDLVTLPHSLIGHSVVIDSLCLQSTAVLSNEIYTSSTGIVI